MDHASLPLSVCPAPKKVVAEASKVHAVSVNLSAPSFPSEAAQGRLLFSVVIVPDLVQGCGVE